MDKLTEEERAFAERYHNTIYSFLRTNKLPVDDFYDVAAFGYLRAVKRYSQEKQLRKYSFTTIAWRAMFADCYRKKKADCIRDALIAFSLNDTTEQGTEYGEFIAASVDSFRELEAQEDLQELLAELMPALTDRQRDHLIKALDGYKPREIMHEQRVPIPEYHADRRAIQTAAADIIPLFCGGGYYGEQHRSRAII